MDPFGGMVGRASAKPAVKKPTSTFTQAARPCATDTASAGSAGATHARTPSLEHLLTRLGASATVATSPAAGDNSSRGPPPHRHPTDTAVQRVRALPLGPRGESRESRESWPPSRRATYTSHVGGSTDKLTERGGCLQKLVAPALTHTVAVGTAMRKSSSSPLLASAVGDAGDTPDCVGKSVPLTRAPTTAAASTSTFACLPRSLGVHTTSKRRSSPANLLVTGTTQKTRDSSAGEPKEEEAAAVVDEVVVERRVERVELRVGHVRDLSRACFAAASPRKAVEPVQAAGAVRVRRQTDPSVTITIVAAGTPPGSLNARLFFVGQAARVCGLAFDPRWCCDDGAWRSRSRSAAAACTQQRGATRGARGGRGGGRPSGDASAGSRAGGGELGHRRVGDRFARRQHRLSHGLPGARHRRPAGRAGPVGPQGCISLATPSATGVACVQLSSGHVSPAAPLVETPLAGWCTYVLSEGHVGVALRPRGGR
jgi:hypothetical protein